MKMKKMLEALFAATLLCCLLAGCGAAAMEDSQPRNVACVVGITNNNPLLDLENIDELADLTALPGSTYTVINAEGTPREICSGTIPDFSDRGYTKAMLERVEASVGADIQGRITAAVPLSPEVDIAASTALAVRALRANAVEGQRDLLVYHLSGISTSGLVDMTVVPVCEMDVEASAERLVEHLDLDMAGIDVLMYCCGDVAGEDQLPLSVQEREKLKEFYRRLFTGLGADSVQFMDDIPNSGSYCFDQQVTAMRTEETASGLQASVIPYERLAEREEALGKVLSGGDVLDFDETAIRFLPDSTLLADAGAARKSLSHVIDYMLDHPDFELLICGTTASAGSRDSCIAFSEKRAEAVREILLNAGIGGDRVHTLGCGYSSPLYIPDRDGEGVLDERIAPRNRTVKLVDCRSDTAAEIMNSLPQAG